MRFRVLVPFVGGALLIGVPARAAHPQERQGFWIGFGAGYGSASLDCDGCDTSNREGSVTGFLKLGGTLSKQVLLGVEGNAWAKDQEGVRLTLGNFSGTLTVYPQASAGFFLKVGAGLAYFDTSVTEGAVTTSVNKTGFGFLAGAGYDLRVGQNVSITPCVNYYYGRPGNVTIAGELVFGSLRQNVFDFGLGVTFH